MADGPTLNLIPAGPCRQVPRIDAVVNPRAQYGRCHDVRDAAADYDGIRGPQGEIILPRAASSRCTSTIPSCVAAQSQAEARDSALARAEKSDGTTTCFEKDGDLYSGCTFSQQPSWPFRSTLASARNDSSPIHGAIGHRLKEYTPQSPGEVMYEGRIIPARTKSVSTNSGNC